MTLRRRLLLIFLGIAVAPIAAVASLVTWQAFRFAEERGREALAGQLETLADLVERRLLVERGALGDLVAEWENPYVPGSRVELSEWFMTRARRQARLGRPAGAFSRFLLLELGRDRVFVVAGRLTLEGVAYTGEWVPDASVPEVYRRRLADAGSGAASEGCVTIWHSTGPVAAVFAALPASRDHPPGLLVEELAAIVLLEELVGQPSFQALQSVFAAAPDARRGGWSYLYHTDPARIGLDAAAAGDVRSPWHFERAGDNLQAVWVDPATGWRLGGSISLLPHLKPVRRSIQVFLALFGLMAALVVLGILLETRGIGKAVEQIAACSGAVARGDLSRVVRLRRSDEFGLIADHVNQMARDLLVTAESRSIARLSARLVHDLKGLASQLNLMVYNLRQNYDDPGFRADCLTIMQDLVDQIESLTLQLRRGGEESEPQWERVDLDRLVGRLLDGRVRAAWPAIVVTRDLAAGGAAVTNEPLLAEVLENLLANAVESMDGRGTLRVRSGPLPRSRRAVPGAPTHFVEIEDTGRGMSQDFVDHELFRPFTTTKPKGLGLGMYQVRQAVLRLGGRIDVRSREGLGTRVRIEVGRISDPGGP